MRAPKSKGKKMIIISVGTDIVQREALQGFWLNKKVTVA